MQDHTEVITQWPDNAQFGLILTHDVDRVKKSYQYITHFFRTGRFYHLKSIFQKINPYWTFDKIMEIERRLNVRSTFFFLNESKKVNVFKLKSYELAIGRYRITEPKIANIIKTLDTEGWEIGLHGSFESYHNKKLMSKEKKDLEKIIGKPVKGIRQHYLNLKIPDTWIYQKELGFEYDATFGNKELGFRDNIKNIFIPNSVDIYVVPTAIMDAVLFDKFKNYKESWEKVISIVQEAKKAHGVLCIIWHTERFNNNDFPGQAQFYIDLINYCKQEGAWIGPCHEAIQYVKKPIDRV
jgi:peptidoglycan/xylan/chitin deacetylase (PgdA/CDA1 family)